ncbi:MAG: SEC-C metal-binding domain-containing protein, partial [Chloroflexi bacterium]|nr:SEC-C metal-binding domain-containing protein [Chloroflexota bacterium]
EAVLERVIVKAQESYQAQIPEGAEDSFRQYERYVMLQILDAHWREHLAALDHLRQGIHLRGYAQKNPKQEYKREAFELFGAMLEAVKLEVTRTLFSVEISASDAVPQADVGLHVENVRMQHADYETALAGGVEERKAQPTVRPTQKVGRNDPCPCGSGKKYKRCHGAAA